VALDKRTGETVWKADPGPGDLSAGDSSVAPAAGGRVLVDTLWRAVLGLDPKTGETLWSIDM
jgi:outer membrane protein assembly factor BamB